MVISARRASIYLFVFAALYASNALAAANKRTDIVMFIADDMSVKDSSAYGNTQIPGPNMSSLAKEGLTFDLAFATSPTCAPRRAADGLLQPSQRCDVQSAEGQAGHQKMAGLFSGTRI